MLYIIFIYNWLFKAFVKIKKKKTEFKEVPDFSSDKVTWTG